MDVSKIIERIEKVNQEQFAEANGRKYISVSKITDFVTEPFDKEESAKKCAEKGERDPEYKYAGMTAEQIIEKWDENASVSRRYGMLLDEYAENVFEKSPAEIALWKLDNNFDNDERLKNNCTGLDEFKKDLEGFGFVYVGREITVYNEVKKSTGENDYVSTGRIDCLFAHPASGKLFIVDWKTTDNITTEGFRGKLMKGPACVGQDCDMGKYTVQLYNYKHSMIDTYGIVEKPDDVLVIICNLLKERDPETGKLYKIFKENFPYDKLIIEAIIEFSVQKRELLKMTEKEKEQKEI